MGEKTHTQKQEEKEKVAVEVEQNSQNQQNGLSMGKVNIQWTVEW